MSKKTAEPKAAETGLESLATRLDALAAEAQEMGEEAVVKKIGLASKSCRHADKQLAARRKRVGTLVSRMKADGLSDAEIVARLTQ